MKGAFAQVHRGIIRNGYSPVPLRPGEKIPLMRKWDGLRSTALTDAECMALVAKSPMLGVGVAGGFNGLLPVDIDTDDEVIIEAICKVLPTPTVAKAGRRGFTAFYIGEGIKSAKLKDLEGRMLVEVLTTGQTVIPPTIHPDTRRPYRWLTRRTLLDTRVCDLPLITEHHFLSLREALAPFMRVQSTWVAATSSRADPAPTSGRLRAWALAAVRREAERLASTSKGGRNSRVFAAGCALGKYIHNGLVSDAEVEPVIANACVANGYAADAGLKACIGAFKRGVLKAVNDALPMLEDRRARQ